MKVDDLTRRLIKKALKSTCEFRVAAIGLNGRGTPIASASNTRRFSRKGGALHAEMAIMRRTPRSLKTIVIVRLGALGNLLPIDPCPACAALAAKMGVTIRTIGT